MLQLFTCKYWICSLNTLKCVDCVFHYKPLLKSTWLSGSYRCVYILRRIQDLTIGGAWGCNICFGFWTSVKNTCKNTPVSSNNWGSGLGHWYHFIGIEWRIYFSLNIGYIVTRTVEIKCIVAELLNQLQKYMWITSTYNHYMFDSYSVWPYGYLASLGYDGPKPKPFLGTLHLMFSKVDMYTFLTVILFWA